MPDNTPTFFGAAPPGVDPNFYNDYVNAAALRERATGIAPGSTRPNIFAWISGRGRDAAIASAQASAPDAYFKLLQQQATAQEAQQNAGQNAVFMGRGGVPVDPYTGTTGPMRAAGGAPPSSPVAAAPAPAPQPNPALGMPAGAFSVAPAAPTAPNATGPSPALGMPQGSFGAPNTSGAPTVNPADAQRAFFTRMAAATMGLPKFAQLGQDYFKMARAGLPDNVATNMQTGQVIDPFNGNAIGQGAQDYAAQGAAKTAAADAGARLPFTIAGQNNEAANQRTTNQMNVDAQAKAKVLSGFDAVTGLPSTATEYDVAHGNAPTFRNGTNPYFAGQQEELKTLRGNATDADQGQQIATQLFNAANGIYTGKGAPTLQDMRKLAQGAAALVGTTVPDSINQSTSQFEQLKFVAQQLVAKASHNLSPRVAQNIYNQIGAVKPGDQSSIKGLRDIITNEIMPSFGRDKAMFGATARYYQKNPMKNDAAAVVPGQVNIGDYAVQRDLSKVKPGDYYVDPNSGNLRQRPVQ